MSVKLTVVYEHPTDPAAFEKVYLSEHIPLVEKIPGVTRIETAKVFPKDDGTPPPAYRTADVYFDGKLDYKGVCTSLESPEAATAVGDAQKIATGGARFLLSEIE